MRNFAIGLAAVGLANAACAQSSVTLFGVVDAGISSYTSKSVEARTQRGQRASQLAMSTSGLASSRLGFRGVEDLGGGLAASFWLEAPMSNDTGADALGFGRRSTLSLSGGFGEIRLGRDVNATFVNDFVFDPLGVNGVGTSLLYRAGTAMSKLGVPPTPGLSPLLANAYARSNNMVAYLLPANLGGFYGQLQYAFDEKIHYGAGALPAAGTDVRSGRYVGGRFGYARGPLDVALAASRSTLLDDRAAGLRLQQDTVNLAAAYDLGPAKLFAEVTRMMNRTSAAGPVAGAPPEVDLDGLLFGVNVPVGPGTIRASYAQVRYDYDNTTAPDPKASQLALSYVHNLSKRTALYASAARIRNKNGAALSVGSPAFPGGGFTPRTSTGYDLGLRHAF